MASRSSKAHRHHQHRAEASAPATSVVVAAARAGEPPQQWERVRAQVRGQQAQQLRRSEAFPPRRTAAHAHYPPRRRQLHKRCDSEINLGPQHRDFGEVAGGTAAGCAAVSCCFPAVMVEVVVLATVRAPAALARKAIRAGRGHRRSASAGQATEIYELVVDDGEAAGAEGEAAKPQLEEEEQAELEKEVWARFYGTGFWRSPSQLSVSDEVR